MIDLHGYLPLILRGFAVTVEVALLSVLISVVLGVVAAAARFSKSKMVRLLAATYSTLVRGVPDLVLMMLVFFGGQILLNWLGDALGWEYIDVDPLVAGVLSIGFIFGAYMSETFRGAILAVPRGEIDAGHAFGMSGFTIFVRITLPACVRHALPGFGNNWLVLVKTTALVSVIGLHDMVHNAAQAGGAIREPFTFYFVVALLYLLLTSVSDVVLQRAARRASAGVRRV